MKIIITELQYNLLKEQEEPKVLRLPGVEYFGGWHTLKKFLEKRGNPLYSIEGDLDLSNTKISSLGNLTSVGGNLYLRNTYISSLGNLISVGGDLDLARSNISSLGNLTSVGGELNLFNTNITSLGNLISVGGDLNLFRTEVRMTHKEIRSQVNVGGDIYL